MLKAEIFVVVCFVLLVKTDIEINLRHTHQNTTVPQRCMCPVHSLIYTQSTGNLTSCDTRLLCVPCTQRMREYRPRVK